MNKVIIQESFLNLLDARILVKCAREWYSSNRDAYSSNSRRKKVSGPSNMAMVKNEASDPQKSVRQLQVPITNTNQLAAVLNWNQQSNQLALDSLVAFIPEEVIAGLTMTGRFAPHNNPKEIRQFWTLPFAAYIDKEDEDFALSVASMQPPPLTKSQFFDESVNNPPGNLGELVASPINFHYRGLFKTYVSIGNHDVYMNTSPLVATKMFNGEVFPVLKGWKNKLPFHSTGFKRSKQEYGDDGDNFEEDIKM